MAMTLGTLEYLISVKTGDMDSTLGKTEKKVKGFGEKLSSWTVAKGQMIARFTEKAVTATADLVKNTVKSAVNAYAEFEQLEGGTKLLFGSAYDFVMKKSAEAYKNVQISQNEYLEQANRFATGLKTSLKGDEQAAATLADRIITAQADVVAATGASRESVQNAFAGLMKGNYTMLDNLQLGIAGTKKGMQDVIKQVNAWNKSNGKATKYQMGNLADMSNALIDYIEMQGLAGYAEREASSTIEGSVASTKAAWQDLLVSMGKGKGIKDAAKNFAKSAKNMMNNIKPIAKEAFKGLVETAKLILPDIIDVGKDLVNEIGRGLFGKDWDITINWIQNAWVDVQNAFTDVKTWVKNTYNAVVNWAQNTWESISKAFTDVGDWVKDKYNAVVEWSQNAWADISNAFSDIGTWVGKQYNAVVNWAQNAWNDISDAFTKAGEWVGNAFNVTIKWIQNAWRTVSNAFSTAGEWVGNAFNVTVEWLQNAWKDISDAFADAGEWVGKAFNTTINWIQNAWDTISGAFTKAGEWAGKAFDTTINWLQNAWGTISDAFTKAGEWVGNTFKVTVSWIQNAWRTVSNAFSTAGEWVGQTFNTTVKWVQDAWDNVSNAFKTAGSWVGKTYETTFKWIQQAWDDVKDAIAQASKGVYDNVVNFTLGLFKAIDDYIASIPKTIEVVVNFVKNVVKQTGENLKVAGENTFGDDMTAEDAMNYVNQQAKGNWTVPYDNYPSLLHRGELVMNKSQARQYRDGDNGGLDVGGLVASAVSQAMSKVYVMMSGEKVGDLTTKRVNRNINASSYNRIRALGG